MNWYHVGCLEDFEGKWRSRGRTRRTRRTWSGRDQAREERGAEKKPIAALWNMWHVWRFHLTLPFSIWGLISRDAKLQKGSREEKCVCCAAHGEAHVFFGSQRVGHRLEIVTFYFTSSHSFGDYFLVISLGAKGRESRKMPTIDTEKSIWTVRCPGNAFLVEVLLVKMGGQLREAERPLIRRALRLAWNFWNFRRSKADVAERAFVVYDRFWSQFLVYSVVCSPFWNASLLSYAWNALDVPRKSFRRWDSWE